jgi:hypothetical protein
MSTRLAALATHFRPHLPVSQARLRHTMASSTASPLIVNPASVANRDQGSDKKSILDWVDPKDTSGEFKRQVSSFRNWISDAPGADFAPESGRYRLYVSYACPWGACPPFFYRHGTINC